MIETERLILRPFRETDREAFAEVNAHPDVGAWVAGTLDRVQSDALMERIRAHFAQHGFGFFAAERKEDGRLVGAIGGFYMAEDLPQPGAIELAWRLHPDVHGQGLASEGARAVRDWIVANRPGETVVAITAVGNVRSRAVMEGLGMVHQPEQDFDHPRLAAEHPLRRHVLYVLPAA